MSDHESELAAGTPIQPTDDERLLGRFREQGDREAIAALYLRHIDLAARVAARFVRHGEEVDDVLQTAFLHLFQHADQHRGGSVRAWILAVVVNSCRMRIREDARRRRREEEAAKHAEMLSEEDAVPSGDATEVGEVVTRAVDALPERYRGALWLVYREGLSVPEAAAALSVPERTLRNHLARAFELLRRNLAGSGLALSATLLGGALAGAKAHAASPVAGAAVTHLAATASTASAAGAAAGAGSATFAAAGMAAVLALAAGGWLIAARPRSSATPAPTAPIATVSTPAVTRQPMDAVDLLLERPVRLRLVHHRLEEAVAALLRALPGERLAVAWPDACAQRAWSGVDADLDGLPLREALDRIAAAHGVAWRRIGDMVVFLDPQAASTAVSAAATLVDPAADQQARLAAIARLGEAQHPDALAPLLLAALGEDPALAAPARRALLAQEPLLPEWPRASLGAVLAADAAVASALRARLGLDDGFAACWCAKTRQAWAMEPLLKAAATADATPLAKPAFTDDNVILQMRPQESPRGRAAMAAATLDGETAAPRLVEALERSRGFYERQLLLSALSRTRTASAQQALRDRLGKSADAMTFANTVGALAEWRDDADVAPIAAIKVHATTVTAIVDLALAQIGGSAGAEALLARAAAGGSQFLHGALASLDDPAALAVCVRAVDQEPLRPWALPPALRAGSTRARVLARESLASALDRAAAGSGDAVTAEVQRLAASRDSDFTAALLIALADPRAAARAVAVSAALATRDPSAPERVRALAESDPDGVVRAAAAAALVEGPPDAAIDAVLAGRARHDDDAAVRVGAVRALARRGVASARDVVAAALSSDPSPAVRVAAAKAVIDAFDGTDPRALADAKGLLAAAGGDADAGVREMAASAQRLLAFSSR